MTGNQSPKLLIFHQRNDHQCPNPRVVQVLKVAGISTAEDREGQIERLIRKRIFGWIKLYRFSVGVGNDPNPVGKQKSSIPQLGFA
jgi:hypothetical protein